MSLNNLCLPFSKAKYLIAAVFYQTAAVFAFSLGSIALLTAPARAQSTAVAPLMTPAELKILTERNQVRVLDIREIFQTDGKTPNYDAGHIPGAIAAPYSSLRGPQNNPGRMIDEEKFSRLLSQWAITPQTHVVIVGTGGDATDFGGAARFYWTFKLAGIHKVSILDGGLGAWMALKYPLSTVAPKVAPTSIKVKFDPALIPNHESIAKAIGIPGSAGSAKGSKPASPIRLIDSRPEEFFKGEDKHNEAARAGTLPGAVHFDQEEFFQLNTGKLLPKSQLASMAKDAGLLGPEDTITFCNTGHWSATMWFVLSEMLGKTNVKMYPESAIGWSKTRLPMDNEPSRLQTLKKDLKEAVSNLKK